MDGSGSSRLALDLPANTSHVLCAVVGPGWHLRDARRVLGRGHCRRGASTSGREVGAANRRRPSHFERVAARSRRGHASGWTRSKDAFDTFNRDLSGLKTGLGEGLLPIVVFLTGRVRHDSYAIDSSWLAGEALLDAEIVAEVSKHVTGRPRPSDISPVGDFGRTWFKVGGGFVSERASFPSGHAVGAFALAAVFSARYRDHRWVPWVAYGVATLVGCSRITLQSHFPSDVFAGGVLGGVIGHAVGAGGLNQAGP
jgi:membrane-associated phospholipid phosphatase